MESFLSAGVILATSYHKVQGNVVAVRACLFMWFQEPAVTEIKLSDRGRGRRGRQGTVSYPEWDDRLKAKCGAHDNVL